MSHFRDLWGDYLHESMRFPVRVPFSWAMFDEPICPTALMPLCEMRLVRHGYYQTQWDYYCLECGWSVPFNEVRWTIAKFSHDCKQGVVGNPVRDRELGKIVGGEGRHD